MEASALPAPAAVTRTRICIGPALLRLRSDEQLVALFRAGHDEAFRVIYDRYRQRLLGYTRQMLSGRQDAEDALQEVFVRAYSLLRTDDRELALRAWLYRVAHNRCIDELRRPCPPSPETFQLLRAPFDDPIAQADQRESLRRLVADVRRLPDQQRSALLMRELSGMPYAEMADALGVSVSAVKSLLVRARIALVRQLEARDTACSEIRDDIVLAHDRGARPGATARRHIRDCQGCREFRRELRSMSRELSAFVPALGPVAVLAKLLGVSGGGGAAAAGSVASSGGALASLGLATGATHVATFLAAAVVTAGGAVEIQHTISAPAHHHHAARPAMSGRAAPPAVRRRAAQVAYYVTSQTAPVVAAVVRPPVVRAPVAPRARSGVARRRGQPRPIPNAAAVAVTGLAPAAPAHAISFVGGGEGAGGSGGAGSGEGSGDPGTVPVAGQGDPTQPPGVDPGTIPPGPPAGGALGTGTVSVPPAVAVGPGGSAGAP